jgi:hypothetical protein
LHFIHNSEHRPRPDERRGWLDTLRRSFRQPC